MNRHMGASFSLSILTVLAFAVLLYEPEPKAAPSEPTPVAAGETAEIVEARAPEADAPPARPPVPSPVLDETKPITTTTTTARVSPVSDPTKPTGGLRPVSFRPSQSARPAANAPPPPITITAAAPAPSGPLPAPRGPLPPRGPFTPALPGESLADIAERVYGTPSATEDLFRANRDELDGIHAPIPEGTMLRTP